MQQELGRMPDWMVQSLGGKDSVLPQLEEADQAQLKKKTAMPRALADVLGGQEKVDAAIAGYNNQRNQGGVGATNGSTIGSAVNSGTGTPAKLGILFPQQSPANGGRSSFAKYPGSVPDIDPKIEADRFGTTARGQTTYTPRFEQPASDQNVVTRADGSKVRLGDINRERSNRSLVGSTVVGEADAPNLLGKDSGMTQDQFDRDTEALLLQNPNRQNNFNSSNTNPRPSGSGAFSTYTPPDYEASLGALKDLKEARIEAAGGRGNRGKGLQDYEKQQSYSQDLADYNSGNVGSEGYNRIRNERMNAEDSMDDKMREVSRSQRGAVLKAGMDNYNETQKARLGVDATAMEAQADSIKAAISGMSDSAKLALEEKKSMLGQYNEERNFGLKQGQLGLDSERVNTDRQYKFGQLGVEAEKLNQGQDRLRLDTADSASRAEARGWETKFNEARTQMDAARLGMEPGKVIDTVMKTENNAYVYPPNVRVQRLRAAGYDDGMIKRIDPEGYAEVMQQPGAVE